jgi:TonB-linked SusC/RagA family outer membrane protein
MNRDIKIKTTMRENFFRKFLRSIFISGILTVSITAFGQTETAAKTAVADTLAKTAESVYKLKGVVRDAVTMLPVSAAQIQTLKSKSAATTDEQGNFEISVSTTGEILKVNAFDYDLREVPVRGRKDIEIDLYSNVYNEFFQGIEGVTGSVRSAAAVSSMKGVRDIGLPTAFSVDDAIQSSLNGDVRTISRPGNSGMGTSLFIRGLNSVNMYAQPLFVVDGVIWNNYSEMQSVHDGFFNNPLNDIDLSDIESFSVLKDGTSIYGSKGGNGVIIIKTKRGEDMATKIVFNAFTGLTDKASSLPLMDGNQFRIYTSDLLGSSGLTSDQIDELPFFNDDPNSTTYKKYHNATNWEDEVYKQGFTHSYNIGVNGGDNKALYYFSLGYTGNNGIVNSVDLQRLNTRTNADFFLSENIKLGMNVGYTSIDRNLIDDGINAYTSPSFLAMVKAPFLIPYTYTSTGTLTADVEDADIFGTGNPTAIIKNALNTNKHYRLSIGFKPEFKLSPVLTLSTQFDYAIDKFKETYYSPMVGVADRELPGIGVSENVFKSQIMRNIGIFDDTQLKFSKQVNEVHDIKAVAGIRYISNNFEMDYGEGHNSGSDQKRNLLDQLIRKTDGANDRVKSISNYLAVDYSFDNRYLLSAAVAVDASSRFGSETQGGFQLFDRSWAVFPSGNAGWLISSENFMADIKSVDLLKLRAGYGLSGNDDIEPYAWSAYFESTRYMDRANGLVLANIGNTEIQWETTAKASLGLDAILFNNRLTVNADFYSNKTKNLLFLKSLPEVLGSGSYWGNGGEMSNKGFEVSAGLKLVNLSRFKWEVGGSISHYKNKIESLPDEGGFVTSFYGAEILTSVGNSAGVFYGYKNLGVFTSEEAASAANLKLVDKNGDVQYFGAGDIHFEDFKKDGIIDENDRQIIGDPNPDFFGSFNSKIDVGNFTLDMLFTYSYGNDVYNALRASLESGSVFANQSTAMLNRWFYEGQETSQPKATYMDPMGNSRFSDRWIEDGSYLRFKTLSLGYNIPLKNSVIDGLKIWVSGNNLFTFTNYLGRDPEVSVKNDVLYQGIDAGMLPLTRSYFIGIKMNL